MVESMTEFTASDQDTEFIASPHDLIVRVWKISHELPEDGRLALFDEEESRLLVLNALGAAFWSRLDGSTTLGDIAREIAESVQGAPEPEDVLKLSQPFLNELFRRGAIAKH